MTTGSRSGLTRHGAAVVTSVLVGLAVAGCGSGRTIPTVAPVKDFCAATGSFSKATRFSDGVKAAEKLQRTGTPKGIPAGARRGFERVVDLVTGSKDKSDLEKRYTALTATQKNDVAALDSYITKTC